MSDLAASVERFAEARVLCVGDAMLDRFVYGQVERISPEAPIPVLRVEREEAMLGGAGNVARNLSALGARVDFVSVVGRDPAGLEVTALIGKLPGCEPHLLAEAKRPTTIKTRYVALGQQLLRADRETAAPIAPATAADVARTAEAALGDCRALAISDYAKGALTPEGTRTMIAAARRAGKPAVVDPKGRDYSRYRGATMLTPNRRELAEATGLSVDGDAAVEAAARRLTVEVEAEFVLCTRGAEGMTLVPRDGAAVHFPAAAREVFDVSGAGDTVLAAMAAGLAVGVAPADAARIANVAAGIVVGKVGTAVAYAADIVRELRHEAADAAERKIVSLAQCLDEIGRWRRQGLRVGFTNGCFDLLHPGHVSLMAQARAAADRLVVGLNGDASVRRLKGEGRPVQSETARAQVLASLASVDLVVVFGEDTPLKLIEAIRPDVLVKGADYSVDRVVGADEVRAWGGRVLLAKLAPGHSTTATIERMAR